MRLITSGIFLAVILSATLAAPAPAADEDSLRLPKSSFPLSYDITLTTQVHTGVRAFTGVVIIEIEISETTNVITLHNRLLQVQSVMMKDEEGIEVFVASSNNREKEFFILTSNEKTFQPGERYTIEIKYLGSLQSGTSGFYRSSYRTGTVTRY
jgi:aminopeptidase N